MKLLLIIRCSSLFVTVHSLLVAFEWIAQKVTFRDICLEIIRFELSIQKLRVHRIEKKLVFITSENFCLKYSKSFHLLPLFPGKTVVFSVHQPPSRVWNTFSSLSLLSQGLLLYSGPIERAIPMLEEASGDPIPPNCNPADYMLDLVNSDFKG